MLEQIETTVGTTPVSVPALKLRFEDAKGAWDEFVQQYIKLRNAAFDNVQHADFHRHNQRVIALGNNALIEDERRRKDEENSEAARRELLAQQEEARRKEAKVAQLTAKLNSIYTHSEKKLDELKAGLDAEVITCMDVLDVRISHLHQVEGLFEESKSLVRSIIEEYPTKVDALFEEVGAKVMEAESKVGACEERLAGF